MAAWLADLDEAGVAVEAEDAAASGCDVLRSPGWSGEDGDGGLADGLETGEAVLELGGELGGGFFGGAGEGEVDMDAVLLGDSGDSCAGGFGVGLDGDGADEAQVDYVAGDCWVVAVAQG